MTSPSETSWFSCKYTGDVHERRLPLPMHKRRVLLVCNNPAEADSINMKSDVR